MKSVYFLTGMIVLVLLVAGCGPSPEQIATMTASAWTPTPLPTATLIPTPTPTPIPYNLTVKVNGQDGNPIAGASVVFPESGKSDPVMTDDAGQLAWNNLAGPAGSLTVSAQGYLTAQQPLNLVRGPNEVGVTLQRDPYGLLPSTACAPGEKPLYLEDFQDDVAQGFGGFQQGLAGLLVGSAPNEDGNTVLILDSTKGKAGDSLGTGLDTSTYAFGDAVWRLRFMVNEPTAPVFTWNDHGSSEFDGQEVQGTVYDLRLWPSPSDTLHLNRIISGPSGVLAGSGQVKTGTFTMVPGQWHYMEISTFQGNYQIWIDGKSELDYLDPKPLPAGSIGLWFAGQLADTNTAIIYADAFSVCGLSAPFVSMPSLVPIP